MRIAVLAPAATVDGFGPRGRRRAAARAVGRVWRRDRRPRRAMTLERRGGMAVAAMAGLRPRRPIGGAAAPVPASAGPPDAEPPVTLADPDLPPGPPPPPYGAGR